MSLEISWEPADGPADRAEWERVIRAATGYDVDNVWHEPQGGLDVRLTRRGSEWVVWVKEYTTAVGMGPVVPTPPPQRDEAILREVLAALKAAGKPAV